MKTAVIVMTFIFGIHHLAVAAPRVIAGDLVKPFHREEVLLFNVEDSTCTATAIGKRVILTAAHCAETGEVGEVTIGGKRYALSMFRHPGYPQNDHDIAIGISKVDLPVEPATVAPHGAAVGNKIYMYGYGCTLAGGTGGNDGKLRRGIGEVNQIGTYDIFTKGKNALCFGDSGGPGYLFAGIRDNVTMQFPALIAGVNSKGNVSDTSYFSRLDLPDVTNFLKETAKNHHVTICGINEDCPLIMVNSNEVEETAPPQPATTLFFEQASYHLKLKAGEQHWVNLKDMLGKKARAFDLLWFTDSFAPDFASIDQKLGILKLQPKASDKGTNYTFALVVRSDKEAAATMINLSLN